MPYRVKIEHPNFREPYFWPGRNEEPMDLGKVEAEQVIADCERLDRNLDRYARQRGDARKARHFTLEWVKADRQLRRGNARR